MEFESPEGLSKEGENMRRMDQEEAYESGEDARTEITQVLQQVSEKGYSEINLSHFSGKGRNIVLDELGRLDPQQFQVDHHRQPKYGAEMDMPTAEDMEEVVSIQNIK